MSFLLDTQIILWSQGEPQRLPEWLAEELESEKNPPLFSVVSIWEVVIKASLNKAGFDYEPREVHDTLVKLGWQELPLQSQHVLAVGDLAERHGDPFDRALVAQAKVEGLTFITADRTLSAYGDHVRLI
jgi:PIN domain nuclease of toxin-antitoxin system